ncbi:MAG TPA: hypothetical protein VK273_07405, partial [Gaiellaceae bacterium]|nr:hypothetical protein [Gaiellaceae bacterium]
MTAVLGERRRDCCQHDDESDNECFQTEFHRSRASTGVSVRHTLRCRASKKHAVLLQRSTRRGRAASPTRGKAGFETPRDRVSAALETHDTTSGEPGTWASVAIGLDGKPVVAYYDATNADLKLVRCNDAACAGGNEKIATLDSPGDVGQYAALQIGVDSVPVVAYLDVTNSKLKVARPRFSETSEGPRLRGPSKCAQRSDLLDLDRAACLFELGLQRLGLL